METPGALRARLDELGWTLPVDDDVDVGALGAPVVVAGRPAPNRFAILPMEGWDGTPDGRPTELVRRRWRRFGTSGAGVVWGGEAVAVRADGRANPNQLCIGPRSAADLAELRSLLGDQVTGLQLTHSGRYSIAPRRGAAHPVLDRRRGGDAPILSAAELDALADDYVAAAKLAAAAGFDFVDVKCCHGYLAHELLAPKHVPLAERAQFMGNIVHRIRHAVPSLGIGVRLSVFDVVPHRAGADGAGEPEPVELPYGWAFGGDGTGHGIDLEEPLALLDLLGVDLVNVTAGSPYYAPHVQRPAYFPPSDGYAPPEDPLVGVARLVGAAVALRRARANTTVVASGLSYLQEFLPNVAGALVRAGDVDIVGIGRMALSYPDLPGDVLAGRSLEPRRICRTFSDCTTAPRNGLVSGCWPLDEHYRAMPERAILAAAKSAARG